MGGIQWRNGCQVDSGSRHTKEKQDLGFIGSWVAYVMVWGLNSSRGDARCLSTDRLTGSYCQPQAGERSKDVGSPEMSGRIA